jgi:fructose-specific phosphotransferase system IIC component
MLSNLGFANPHILVQPRSMDFFNSVWLLPLVAVAFLQGLFWVVNQGSYSPVLHRLTQRKFWREISQLPQSPLDYHVVHHSPTSLYLLVWQHALAIAAGGLVACLALLAFAWVLLVYGTILAALLVGLSLMALAYGTWQWLAKLP